ncbi:MAG: Gfo/Idh/MocA family protein [Chloroflexota bacterium]
MAAEETSLRAGVVGLGIGAHHAAAYAAHPSVTLAALCDSTPDRLAASLRQYPAATGYTSLDEMLSGERLNLVSICTPDWLHAEMGIAALQAGAHVICTKPLTTTVEDARALLAAAEASGRSLMAAHERRFTPLSRAIKAVLDRGLLGDLFYVSIDYFDHKERQFNAVPWYKSAEHPRSAMLGTGSHAVDLVRWFAGEVNEVWGVGNHLAYPDFPDDDCMVGVFKLAGGAIGKVTQTYASIRGMGEPELRITLHGTKGSIEDDKFISRDLYDGAPGRDIAGRKPWRSLPAVAEAGDSHMAQMNHFIAALLADEHPEPDGREGARTVAACLAVIESSRTGKPARPAAF